MLKKLVEPERTQAIWRLCVAYWISKPIRGQAHALAHVPTPTTLSTPPTHKYVILIAFPL